MTEGLVRTSTAPFLSCGAGDLREKKDKETMRRTSVDNRAQVVMELTFCQTSCFRGWGWRASVIITMYCVCERVCDLKAGVVNLTRVCICV